MLTENLINLLFKNDGVSFCFTLLGNLSHFLKIVGNGEFASSRAHDIANVDICRNFDKFQSLTFYNFENS